METEIKMLSDIHKNADMGQDTLRHILDATKDAEFSKCSQTAYARHIMLKVIRCYYIFIRL